MPHVSFTINNRSVKTEYEQDESLLWVIRDRLRLTGTKFGCGEGKCGACIVLIDGEAIRSCQFPAEAADGTTILTIEGLVESEKLHPLQQAFIDHDGFCCGYCTPGMIMNAVALLQSNPQPTREEIISGMDDNICRCGAYPGIIKAIEAAARQMSEVDR